MKKTLLTSFALLLGLAASAQTYFSQTIGTNAVGMSYNSGFASVKTTAGTYVTVAATNAGGFEVSTFSSAGTLMLTTKLANSMLTIDNVAYGSELPDGSILVTGTGNIAGASQFYIAKINLLTNEINITYKVAETFSYTKGPRAFYSNGAIYAAFPQYAKFDLNKYDTDLNQLWAKCGEGDTTSGKNPGNDCGLLDDTTIIVVGKSDTTLSWGEYDTTGSCDSMRFFGIAGYTRIYGMTRTADGNMLLAGLNQSYTTFSTNPILMKVSANGNIIWAKIIDATALVRFVDVEELPDGKIIAVGTTMEAYSDTYFDGAITFDASGNITNALTFGSTQKFYYLYDIKVCADGLLMSGVINDYATGTMKNALIFTDFNFSIVCDKTPYTATASNLANWGTTAVGPGGFKATNGVMGTTAAFGLMTLGASSTPEICSITTGVNEMENTTANVYPNPVLAGSNVTVTMSTAGNYTVNVINATGALVSTGGVTGTTATINTQNMTTGLYIVNVYASGVRVSSQKIAVK